MNEGTCVEQAVEPEDAADFEYHAMPPLSVIRIRARVRAVYVGLPMPYDVTRGE